jgi:hypothetical protein
MKALSAAVAVLMFLSVAATARVAATGFHIEMI